MFERRLNNDNKSLSRFLIQKYNKMAEKYNPEQKYSFESTGSISTMKWNEYNAFQYYEPNIYNIFVNLKDMVKEACEYYQIDFVSQKYMAQSWFNVNSRENGKLNWHRHNPKDVVYEFNFHGYYGVKVSPSSTMYKDLNGNIYENVNEDGKMILSSSNFFHSMQDWDWEGPRISLAYDVSPLEWILDNAWDDGQHWIPLGY